MKHLILTFLVTLISLPSFAGGMSEVDLMTREEIANYFANQNISIEDIFGDIAVEGFVTPFDDALCDFEVSAWVRYKNKKGRMTGEACYVCFSIQAKGTKYQYIDPEETYCLE